MARVNVIYHHFPHYRRPVLQALAASSHHDYSFWGSHEAVAGIEPFRGDESLAIRPLQFATRGRRWVLSGYWPAVLDHSVDAVIILANPNMLATWKMALVARLKGKKVLFWAHGWLKREPLPKRLLRHVYFRLAHTVMVYGTRRAKSGGRAVFRRSASRSSTIVSISIAAGRPLKCSNIAHCKIAHCKIGQRKKGLRLFRATSNRHHGHGSSAPRALLPPAVSIFCCRPLAC